MVNAGILKRKVHKMSRFKNSSFILSATLVVTLLVLMIGCSGGGSAVTPDLTSDQLAESARMANRIMWGLWHVTIDPVSMTAEAVPLRGAEFTANVTRFMQPPASPVHMLSFGIDPISDPATGYFAVDVTVNHPFPGLNMYNGFDVRGILYSNGSLGSDYDGTILRAGSDDTYLMNPDGYTRWWNWEEFTSFESIFGATRGKLAPPNQPSATVNGYKYFADGLELEDAVTDLGPSSRGFLSTSAPGSCTRRYDIQFKMNDEEIVFDFNYAVDASWSEPDPSYEPDYPQEAFDVSANCQEAYNIAITDNGTDAWYEGPGDFGGEIRLNIEVFDWQGGAYNDVPGEVAMVYADGDVLGGYVDLTSATVNPGSTVNSSVWETAITYEGNQGAGDYEILIGVESADPTSYEPQIDGGSAFAYPDSPLTAFNVFTVTIGDQAPYDPPTVTAIDPDEGIPDCTPEHVTVTGTNFVDGSSFYLQRTGEEDIVATDVVFIDSTTLEGDLNLAGAVPGLWDVVVEVSPGITGVLTDGFTILDAIYVDGDNAGDPSMDGTPDHPYDTIQKGIDAAYASNDEPVIVDQSASDYSPFTMYNNSHVIGCNWNDGSGWPTVDHQNTHAYSANMNNITIEGLQFECTLNTGSPNGMYFSQGDGINIKDCRFTGIITTQRGYILRFARSENIEISGCEFTEIYHRGADNDWRSFYVVYGGGIDGMSVHHSEFHKIGYDVYDTGQYGTSAYLIRVGYDSVAPHNVDFHNILMYDFFNKTDCIRPSPNPDPQNAMTAFSLSNINSWDWVGEFKLYNVTVDDIRHADPPTGTTVNAGHVNAGYFGMVGGDDIVWKNNIVSNIEGTDDYVVYGNTSYYGWWVDGYVQPGPSPYPMDYSGCYNICWPDLPPGENSSSGWYTGFCNQVSGGTGAIFNYEAKDPQYDMNPGANFYHPTNTEYSEGADDGGEMGAFGGPEGDWTPPSQL